MPSARRPPTDSRSRGAPGRSGSDAPGSRSEARSSGGPRQRPARQRSRREGSGSDLLARVVIAVPAAIVAITFVDLGGLPFALFMIAIGWVCMHELYRMLARWRPVALVGFLALAGMVLAARYGSQREVLEVAVATVPVLFLFVLARPQPAAAAPAVGVTVAIAATLLGVYWLGLAFAHAELLRQVNHGGGIIIDVLVGTFLGDTGAYVGGRLFGRRPLAPKISPNKTVEGLFCGMLVAIVAVFLAGLYQTWLTQGDALLLGLTVAILAPLGDLFESAVKRDAGLKDAGHAFGVHGGALDRLDAVIFTTVAGYYVWIAVMH
jgi:phosphatidate cytidylyltransferase